MRDSGRRPSTMLCATVMTAGTLSAALATAASSPFSGKSAAVFNTSRILSGVIRGGYSRSPSLDSRRKPALAFRAVPQLSLHTPIGDISVSEEDGAVVAIDWGWGSQQNATPLLRRACDQLHAYFDGDLTEFD